MIITDLNHLELVTATDVVGSSGDFYYSTYKTQFLSNYQSSYAQADAESQFGKAESIASSSNVAFINQEG